MRRGTHKKLGSAAFLAAVGTFAYRASAIIIYGDPGNNFSTIPDSINQYLGYFGSYIGTPISANTFVTAAHITGSTTGSFIFSNGDFSSATTYSVQLAATLDDLAIWQIAPNDNATFSVYAPLYNGGDPTGKELIDTGRGVLRGSAVTGGWQWGESNGGEVSWGDNTVASVLIGGSEGFPPNISGDFLTYAFNNSPTDPNECILANQDSGGSLFIDNNGTYQIDGVNSLVDTVYDSNGNQLSLALYDENGYYTYNNNNQLVQITNHPAMSSYATEISSKLNLVDAITGVIPPSEASAFPVENYAGLCNIYSSVTVGGMTQNGYLVIGQASTPATLTFASGSTQSSLASLSITPGSSLDVTNTQVFINYNDDPDPKATILGYLASGCNGGAWNGTGIISSAANSNYGVGFVDGADNLNPTLIIGELEFGYALYGDITMQGLVNANDFHILVSNFGQVTTDGWEAGDFLYQGVVNAEDFHLLAQNFGQTASGNSIALPASEWAALEAFAAANGLTLGSNNVPEPTSGLLVIGAGLALCRRRRRSY